MRLTCVCPLAPCMVLHVGAAVSIIISSRAGKLGVLLLGV